MLFQHRAQRLDHDLFRIGKPVHHQPELAPIGIQHGDELIASGRRVTGAPGHQQLVEKHQRQQLVRAAGKAGRPRSTRCCSPPVPGGTCTSSDNAPWGRAKLCCRLRTISAGMMARVSGMRRRSVVPLPGRESSSTLPPMRLHVGAHHVHAHAAPAHVGDRCGGGEAGQEDQLQQLAFRLLRGALLGDQPAFDSLGANPLHRDAGAVIRTLR